MSGLATPRKRERWQPEEEQILLAKYKSEKITQIAEYLGKPRQTVSDKLTYLRKRALSLLRVSAASITLTHQKSWIYWEC